MKEKDSRSGLSKQPKTSRINVTLDPDTIASAKRLGTGNLSRGLRIAVKQSQELERALKQLSEYRPKPK